MKKTKLFREFFMVALLLSGMLLAGVENKAFARLTPVGGRTETGTPPPTVQTQTANESEFSLVTETLYELIFG